MENSHLYGILSVLSVFAALGAPEGQRGRSFVSAGLLCAGWWLFIASWSDTPPASLFWAIGLPVEPVDIWAVTDALCAAIILALAYQYWWGKALWALLVCQLALHVIHQHGGLGFAPYSAALDVLFLAQLAVLFLLGGGGVVAAVSDRNRHVRDARHPYRTASQEE
ncbi:hypothetical protein [Sphingomonas japonica]|uniref:Uncharacterized protein n=1 Tax=Sphingomonas japonica TaxID=511662 RepID=A0ABX0U7V1_9SPHN|nr:hypothetical protein [Sphingomonas japonica]NIJ24843.1 hypothetical protein [Sphingomonas japonica]